MRRAEIHGKAEKKGFAGDISSMVRVRIPPPASLYSNHLVVLAGEFLEFLRFGSSGFFQQELG
jgi:hypothetical protein